MALTPGGVLFGAALHHAALVDAVLILGKGEFLVVPDNLLTFRLVPHHGDEVGPVAVQPLQVHRVQRVLLALQPVARQYGQTDVPDDVADREHVPVRHQRRGRGAHVGEQQPGLLLHRVRLHLDLVLEPRLRVLRLLVRLLRALARLVVQPAVVRAAQAMLFRDAVDHVHAPVGAVRLHQAEGAGAVLVEDEVLAEEAHLHRPLVVHLGDGGDGVPVAAHQLAGGCAGADSGVAVICFLRQHRFLLTTLSLSISGESYSRPCSRR